MIEFLCHLCAPIKKQSQSLHSSSRWILIGNRKRSRDRHTRWLVDMMTWWHDVVEGWSLGGPTAVEREGVPPRVTMKFGIWNGQNTFQASKLPRIEFARVDDDSPCHGIHTIQKESDDSSDGEVVDCHLWNREVTQSIPNTCDRMQVYKCELIPGQYDKDCRTQRSSYRL